MKLPKLRYITPLLAAASAAAWIAGAPVAAADTSAQLSCNYINGSMDTQCSSPGNTQINDSPPPVEYVPQYPYWEGGYGYGYGGGFHGGGGHR
jgi:hypothetical protein